MKIDLHLRLDIDLHFVLVPFASLIIRTFQLLFSVGTVLGSLTTNQRKQCFCLFFQRSERDLTYGSRNSFSRGKGGPLEGCVMAFTLGA